MLSKLSLYQFILFYDSSIKLADFRTSDHQIVQTTSFLKTSFAFHYILPNSLVTVHTGITDIIILFYLNILKYLTPSQ